MSIPGCLVIQHPGGDDTPGSWQIIVGDQSDRIAAGVPPVELATCDIDDSSCRNQEPSRRDRAFLHRVLLCQINTECRYRCA